MKKNIETKKEEKEEKKEESKNKKTAVAGSINKSKKMKETKNGDKEMNSKKEEMNKKEASKTKDSDMKKTAQSSSIKQDTEAKNPKKEVKKMKAKKSKKKTAETSSKNNGKKQKTLREELIEEITLEEINEAYNVTPKLEKDPKLRVKMEEKAKKNKKIYKILKIIDLGISEEEVINNNNKKDADHRKPKMDIDGATLMAHVAIMSEEDRKKVNPIKYIDMSNKEEIIKQNQELEEEIDRKEKEKKQKQEEKTKKERKRKKQKEEKQRKEQQEKAKINRYKRLAKLAKINGKQKMDDLGNPITTVTYSKKKARLNGLYVDIVDNQGKYTNFMWQKVLNPSMRKPIKVPVKIMDGESSRLFAVPLVKEFDENQVMSVEEMYFEAEVLIIGDKDEMIQELNNIIEERKNGKNKSIRFFADEHIKIKSNNKDKRIVLTRNSLKEVLSNPEKFEGIIKMKHVNSKDADHVLAEALKQVREFSEEEAQKKRAEAFGVHKHTFTCNYYHPIGGMPRLVPQDTDIIKSDNLILPRKVIEKIESNVNNPYTMKYIKRSGQSNEKTTKAVVMPVEGNKSG
jgi:hypothetical protein